MDKPSSSKLVIIKVSRVLVYLVYAWLVIATVFLLLGFILLLLGANTTTPFVEFVYKIAANFLAPFRGMFPPTKISDTSYFSAAGLFAIIFYSICAFFIHALIDWITMKLRKNEIELQRAAYEERLASQSLAQQPVRKTSSRAPKSIN